MMASSHLTQKPNTPIFLEDAIVTHIEGQRLPKPCSGRVTLHLSPRIICRIDLKDLPRWLANSQGKALLVTLKNGCEIKVLLFPNLNDLLLNKNPNGTFKGFLVPCKCPCTVIQPATRIRSIRFSVLNFLEFYGQQDKWIDVDGHSHRLGAVKIEHNGLRIEISQDPGFSDNLKLLKQEGGYAVTHTGSIQRFDRETFCVKDAENILRGLRAFLSFARGSACGLTLVKAIAQDDREMILEWGTSYVEPWRARSAWLPLIDGGDSLSQLFPGFWNLYSNPDWRDTISTVIDWYLNSNNGPFHVGITLAQAALESVCYKIVGKELTAEVSLRESLEQIGIDKKIPTSCPHLKKFSEQKVQGRKNEHGNRYIGDGPEAIIQIRNDLIHAKKKYDALSAEAQMDALRLGLWYIELILLRKFEYRGRYVNRLRVAGEKPFENVPWASENVESSATK